MPTTEPVCLYIEVVEAEPSFTATLSADKTRVCQDEVVTFTVRVRNTGTKAGTFHAYLTCDGDKIDGTDWSDSLAVYEEKSKDIPVHIGETMRPDTYQICVNFA